MTHAKLIVELGDNLDLARVLKRDVTSVSRWKREGIPPSLWPHVARLAAIRGLDVTVEQIAAAHPLWGTGGRRGRGRRRHRGAIAAA